MSLQKLISIQMDTDKKNIEKVGFWFIIPLNLKRFISTILKKNWISKNKSFFTITKIHWH